MVNVNYYCCFDEPKPKPQPPKCEEPKFNGCCCINKESSIVEDRNLDIFFIKNRFVDGYGYYLSTQTVDCCNPNGYIYPLNGTKARYLKQFELIPRVCVYPK